MIVKNKKNPFFSRKEQLNFTKLCQVHGFKNRQMIKDDATGNIIELAIYLPQTYGTDEKMLGNIARYTNSRRSQTPCIFSKNKLAIKVSYKKS